MKKQMKKQNNTKVLIKNAGFKPTPKIFTSVEEVREHLRKKGEIIEKPPYLDFG